MSVGLEITANTQSAQAALKQLQNAFKELQQEGKRFTEIDLGDIGTDQLKRDLKIIQDNWKGMTDPKIGGKRAERLNQPETKGKAPWEIDPRHAAPPHATDAQIKRIQQELIESLLRGISGTNPELPRPPERLDIPNLPNRQPKPSSPGASGETPEQRKAQREADREAAFEKKESEQRRQQIMGGVMGGAKFTAGMVGVQTGLEAIQSAYQGANDIGKYTDEFMRRTQDVGHDFNFLKGQISDVGKGLGVASDEAAKLTLAFTRTAHATTIKEAVAGTQAAVGLAVGFGADKDQTVQQMARLSLIGATGKSDLVGAPGSGSELTTKDKKFALKLAQAVGQNNVPLEKVLGDFARLAESSVARTTKEPATDNLLGYLKSLYDVADKGRPGLKGEAGMALLSRADEGLRNSTNPATELLMYKGLSEAMETEDFLQIQRQREAPILAPILNQKGEDTGKTNLSVYVDQMEKKHAGNKNPLIVPFAVSEGLNMGGMENAAALIAVDKSFMEQGQKGGAGNFQKQLESRNIKMDTLREDGFKDLSDILKFTGKPGEQFTAAKQKLTEYKPVIPLHEGDQKNLEKLQADASTGDPGKQKAFVDELIKQIAEHGAKETPWLAVTATLAELKTAMIKNVGEPIVYGINQVAEILKLGFNVDPEAKKKYTEEQVNSRNAATTANDEIAKAQKELDDAPPEKKAEATKHLQDVTNEQRAKVDAASNGKKENYFKQRSFLDKFVDQAIGFWIPGKHFMDNTNPIGMEESPAEEQFASQGPSPRDQLEQKIKAANMKLANIGWVQPEKRKEAEQEIDALEKQLAELPAPIRRATGGIIPGGFGGGDRVPALLTPGEFVINASAAQKNLPLLHQINQGDDPQTPARFATGGTVPGKPLPITPATTSTLPPNSTPTGATTLINTGDDTPTAVKELQKRLEQLFDPVTRYLAELAHGAKALQAGRGTGDGAGIAAVLGAGPGVTAPDGTPTAPLTDASRSEAQKGLSPSKPASPAQAASPPTIHKFTGQTFPGDGRGFLSPGAGKGTAAAGRSTTAPVAPPAPCDDPSNPDCDKTKASTITAKTAQEGATSPESGAATGTATPSAKTAQGSGKPGKLSDTQAEFIRKYRPAAEKAAAELGVSADTLLAQAAHETGWGKHMPPGSNNMFGIKADKSWKGKRVNSKTGEVINGQNVSVNAGFRAYDSPEESFSDYAKFLQQNPRYKSALEAGKQGNDPEYMRRLQQAGYATDPNYANKVENIKRGLPGAAGSDPADLASTTPSARSAKTGGPGGSGPTPKSQQANKGAELANYYKERLGLTDNQAAALAGNAIHESSLNTNAKGDNGSAHGIFQWRNDRWQRLQEYAKKSGRSANDWNVQKEFAAVELETTESKALERLKQTSSVEDASRSINKNYERSADTIGSDMDRNRIRQSHAVLGVMGNPSSAETPAAAPVPPPAPDTDTQPVATKAAQADPKAPRKSGDGLGDPRTQLLQRTDDEYTPKPLNAPEYTPRPKETIPEPKLDQANNYSGQGIGHLDITLTQADAHGARLGNDVNHRMNLRTTRPHGAVSVASVNQAA